jgi:outer membrane protein TolC
MTSRDARKRGRTRSCGALTSLAILATGGALAGFAPNARAQTKTPPAPAGTAVEAEPPPPVTTPTGRGTGLRLQDAIQLVLTRNERVRISDLNVVVAEAAVERARTAFLPLLTANASDTLTAAVAAGQPNNVGTGGLVITQPLVNVPSWPLYWQARALADAQHAQNVDDRRVLTFNAAAAFFAVLGAQGILDAAKRQLENARSNLADTQARADAQLTSSNDVTRAQIDLTSAEREAAADAGNCENAYVQLAFIINAPALAPLDPPADTLKAAEIPVAGIDDLVHGAVARRPDVLSNRHLVAAARDFADEPLLRIVPTLNLQATATGTTNVPTTTHQFNNETVSANLTWTLYDSGVRYADKHSRDAQAEIADLTLKLLVRSVDAQIRSAAALLQSAQTAFSVAYQAMLASQQNVEETAILYRQGLAKAIELVDANDARFTAEVNYADTQYTMEEAYLNLRQALGLDALGTELK